jgi:hypothetical protein
MPCSTGAANGSGVEGCREEYVKRDVVGASQVLLGGADIDAAIKRGVARDGNKIPIWAGAMIIGLSDALRGLMRVENGELGEFADQREAFEKFRRAWWAEAELQLARADIWINHRDRSRPRPLRGSPR